MFAVGQCGSKQAETRAMAADVVAAATTAARVGPSGMREILEAFPWEGSTQADVVEKCA